MELKTKAHQHDFYLPSFLNASHPPERRGLRRDQVKMMVLDRITGNVVHDQFIQLEQYLNAGDILVLNNSRTIPAILKGEWHRNGKVFGTNVELRLARKKNDSVWEALIIAKNVETGDCFKFSEAFAAKVVGEVFKSPLKMIQFTLQGKDLYEEIYSMGEPIRYEYIHHPWNLDYYQTVFASQPGSVEMPSAGRAFSWELLLKLQQKGVKLAFLQLHTGLSYLLDDEYAHSPEDHFEEYSILHEDMEAIVKAKGSGGRIIAAGTTVVRALETAAANSTIKGWTNLYITSDYELQLVDGIITGFHEPKASHLDMLTAFIDENMLFEAYNIAIQQHYLWHEFGDINLII
ncbi:S-adenosylmethionine:tRNA ribosyltransferase-isomerase [Mesobacillus boroniphilus]|uniref:S-adenosylmethionine:tRNA ribosyltransferase-isomerase n=1 Tax=Mesobacillus boroniphilus TaxID=308892 RepID=A0A944GX17_9BACI|nr:S-adenosylmethionine:tRNA ribosyltransferase-isomerase [Mesobacillus boroniphilus]MBS8264235.1 S-adenosylmethionine:tRNA ribosyltransferase-isomerase [Mesobacillus boroniphilus]